ncbi:MAG TPA: VWA domain-containing protein [Candidatus Saccharimonadales bacterium]|jgi:Ca-activated chloride channel family protein|nr:VWA domain-containing protein [Candidatus Saccharimonadales bacterium]
MARINQVGQPLLAVLFLLVAAPSLRTAQSQNPAPPIRVIVNRVNVGVTVTDAAGRFIEGLRNEDFQIFDNGVEQPITDFLSIEEPAHLLLLIESGPAVYFLGQGHFRAADTLLTSISPADRVAVAAYSNAPDLILGFTPDKAAARFALQNLNFNLGFAELNLSSSVAATLDWMAQLPGKKTIVLLSTGVDTSPPENWRIVQQKLQTSDVRILAVSLSGDFRKPVKGKKRDASITAERDSVNEGFRKADESLQQLAAATGGRVYFPTNADEFSRAYAEIAQLIRHEYSLAFAPPAADGQLHSLKVKTKNASYQVDHRQAYLAPPTD